MVKYWCVPGGGAQPVGSNRVQTEPVGLAGLLQESCRTLEGLKGSVWAEGAPGALHHINVTCHLLRLLLQEGWRTLEGLERAVFGLKGRQEHYTTSVSPATTFVFFCRRVAVT